MQFRMLGHFRLDEERGHARVETRSQPVDHHAPGVFLEFRSVLITCGQRVPVRDEKIALILILKLDPILQGAVIVAQVQLSCGTHAGQDAPVLYGSAHTESPMPRTWMSWPAARYAGRNSQPSSPSTDKPTTMNMPAGAILSSPAPNREGRTPTSNRPPSKGGIGRRLNAARTALTWIPAWAMSSTQLSRV